MSKYNAIALNLCLSGTASCEVSRWDYLRSAVPGHFPHPPSDSIRPIDQVEMVHIINGAFVDTPSRACTADKPIVVAFHLLDDIVGLSKC